DRVQAGAVSIDGQGRHHRPLTAGFLIELGLSKRLQLIPERRFDIDAEGDYVPYFVILVAQEHAIYPVLQKLGPGDNLAFDNAAPSIFIGSYEIGRGADAQLRITQVDFCRVHCEIWPLVGQSLDDRGLEPAPAPHDVAVLGPQFAELLRIDRHRCALGMRAEDGGDIASRDILLTELEPANAV